MFCLLEYTRWHKKSIKENFQIQFFICEGRKVLSKKNYSVKICFSLRKTKKQKTKVFVLIKMKKFLILSYNLYWYVGVVSNFLKFLQRTAPFQRLVYYRHFSIKLSTSPPVKTPYPLEHKSYTIFQKIFICDGIIRTQV